MVLLMKSLNCIMQDYNTITEGKPVLTDFVSLNCIMQDYNVVVPLLMYLADRGLNCIMQDYNALYSFIRFFRCFCLNCIMQDYNLSILQPLKMGLEEALSVEDAKFLFFYGCVFFVFNKIRFKYLFLLNL